MRNKLLSKTFGWAFGFLILCLQSELQLWALAAPNYPGKIWERRSPEQSGLSEVKLASLAELVGGRGCVVRHGYMVFTWGDQTKSSDVASAFKPLLTTLLFMAVQEGRLMSVDDKVAAFESRLKALNGGKDAAITWRHFASQTSGYGLAEAPGQAYSYNDYALALYYDTLTHKVFGTNGTAILRSHLAEPLQFEDAFTFDAFGPNNRPGRLAISIRDFARFGLLYLRRGTWRDRQLLRPDLVEMAVSSPLSPDTPLTSGKEAEMLPNQRSIGGTRTITPVGPGYYSFNWWLSRTNKQGRKLFAAAPADTYVAAGHGGMRMLWIIPSLDLIVCWNESKIEDQEQSPGNPNTKCNQAAQLITGAVIEPMEAPTPNADSSPSSAELRADATTLGIQDTRFTMNGKPAFLLGLSYYGGLGASEEFWHKDLADMRGYGFNWIRVWATWSSFSNNVSAVDAEGNPREPFISRLKQLLIECDRRGVAMDITLSRGNGVTGAPRLQTLPSHRRAVETLVNNLKPYRNWYLDLSNERNIRDERFTSIEDLKDLRQLARKLDPDRLVTASHGGDISQEELGSYLETVRVDFISPHRPREGKSLGETASKTVEYFRRMEQIGRVVPVHYQEPFRRGYGGWEPSALDFVTDARNAQSTGAAGWCFHNGDERRRADAQPRRSFDMGQRRLFEQLDAEEQKAIVRLTDLFRRAR